MLVFLASCGDMEPEDPKLTGEWVGQLTAMGNSVTYTFNLSEKDDGTVTGTVTYEIAEIRASGTAMGTHIYPDVELRLQTSLSGRPPGVGSSYKAKLTTKDKMDGTFQTDDGSIEGPLSVERSSG